MNRQPTESYKKIGEVYGNGESAYYEIEGGVQGPLAAPDIAHQVVMALGPHIEASAAQAAKPDRITTTLRRAFYTTGIACFIGTCALGGYIANAVNQTRAKIVQEWEGYKPALDEMKQEWSETKPTLDDVQEKLGNVNEALDKLAECTSSPSELVKCLNPLK